MVNVHQDGGSRGKPRPSAAARAPRTIVSTTTADDQTILSARREMQQWRRLRGKKNSFSRHRNVLLQRLDPFGAVRDLPSWQCLERDIKRALEQLENQN